MNKADARVFVVDDDESVQKGLYRLLSAAGYRAEVFGSAPAFLGREPHDGPACLVLDVQLPGLNGLELQQALLAADNPLPIIFITGHGDIPMSVRAIKAGAVDFLPKPFSADALLASIQNALEKSESERDGHAERAEIKQRLKSLTAREYEVLCGVLKGRLNKQIAGDLGIAEQTVKIHRGRVMQKMQVASVAELVQVSQAIGVGS